MRDITIPKDTWTNLYTLAGITAGTVLDLQNKASTRILVQESFDKPMPADRVGRIVNYAQSYVTQGVNINCWIYSEGRDAVLNVIELV